jgi:hypothetical protein
MLLWRTFERTFNRVVAIPSWRNVPEIQPGDRLAELPASVLATTGTGSIYAGAPRTFVAGMKLAFR